jgi:hypothetical protein
MKINVVRPSSCYQLVLPNNVCEQADEGVSSFWVDGEPLLLQLSSYLRENGEQLAAKNRMKERIAKHSHAWRSWNIELHPDLSIDQASAEFVDVDGVLWVHSYLVWPHLTIYSTLSGPEKLVKDPLNWALQGLKSVRLIAH